MQGRTNNYFLNMQENKKMRKGVSKGMQKKCTAHLIFLRHLKGQNLAATLLSKMNCIFGEKLKDT